jgi:hypothetical protein
MTYENDPNINNRNRRVDNNTSYTGWIVGGLVALAVVVGIFMMTNRNNTNTATNDTTVPRATTTAPTPAVVPPATTGSAPPVESAPAAR